MIVNGKNVCKENFGKFILNIFKKISRKALYSWKCYCRNDAASLILTVSFSLGGFKANCWSL